MVAASLIPPPTTRGLARELGSIRRELETIKAGGRTTQLDRSSLMYPLIIRDPNTGEVLGSFGPNNGSAALVPIGGAPPPAPSTPILTPLVEGVLVEWDGTFVDPNYVPPLLAARGMQPRGVRVYGVAPSSGKLSAAQQILDRLKAGQPIFEDWSWAGMPAVVGTWNDTLLDEARAFGLAGNNWPFSAAARDWLQDVIDAGADPNAKMTAAVAILARLNSGQPIFEDWTWSGMPIVVGDWNDVLLDAAEASGLSGPGWPTSQAAKDWLTSFIEGDVEVDDPTTGDTDTGSGILTPDIPEKVAAAEAILNRMRAGKPINDDWTFPGNPYYVTTHGPILNDEWNNRGTAVAYLQYYVESRSTRPHNFGYVGIHTGPTQDFVTDPSNLRGTLTGAGTFPVSPVSEETWVRLVGYNNSTPPVSGPASDTVSAVPSRVVATEILDGIVTEVALADLSVSTAKVQIAAIQAQLLAAASVTGPAIAPGSVGTTAFQALSVTAETIAANAIRAGSIDVAAVTAAAIAAGAVNASKILANSIGAQQIAAEAIDATHLRAQAVTASKIAALAVTAGAIAANAINAGHITAGAVTADKLAALLVMATRIIAGDPLGSRAEINTGGIFGFQGSLRTFSLRSDGTAFMNGMIEAGTGNDRILIQPQSGSGRPELHFFALPTNPAYINAVPVQINGTSTDGVGIGMNSGPRPTPFVGRQTTVLVRPDRASMAYTAIGSGAARGGQTYVDANFADLAHYNDSGTLTNRLRLGDTGVASTGPVSAPSFPITSDPRAKTAVGGVDWDPFTALKGRIGRFRYRELEPGRTHVGPVDANDFPRWMHRVVTPRPDEPDPGNDYITLGLEDLVGVALLMCDRLDDRVAALEAPSRVS